MLSSLTSSLTLLQHAYIQKQLCRKQILCCFPKITNTRFSLYFLVSGYSVHLLSLSLSLPSPKSARSHFLFSITISHVILHFPCTTIFLLLHAWLQLFLAFKKSPSVWSSLTFFILLLLPVHAQVFNIS